MGKLNKDWVSSPSYIFDILPTVRRPKPDLSVEAGFDLTECCLFMDNKNSSGLVSCGGASFDKEMIRRLDVIYERVDHSIDQNDKRRIHSGDVTWWSYSRRDKLNFEMYDGSDYNWVESGGKL